MIIYFISSLLVGIFLKIFKVKNFLVGNLNATCTLYMFKFAVSRVEKPLETNHFGDM